MKSTNYNDTFVLNPTRPESQVMLSHLFRQLREKRNAFDHKIKRLNRGEVYTVYLPDPLNPGKQLARKVQLTHDVVLRYRNIFGRKEPRYSVLDNEPLGQGYFSKVYNVLGTLVENTDGSLNYKTEKDRVIKIQDRGVGYPVAPQSPKSESLLLQRTSPGAKKATTEHFNLFHSRSYTIDEKFGTSLNDIDARKLTEDQKLTVTLNLLRALQSFHALGFAHRDLHTGNIQVDLKTLKVRIIDPAGASPLNADNQKEDIANLFHNPYSLSPLEEIWIDSRRSHYFKLISSLEFTANIAETIDRVEKFRIKEKKLPNNETALVQRGFAIANQAYVALDKINQNKTRDSLGKIRSTLVDAIENIGDSSIEIQEFTRTLNIDAFRNLTTKDQLKSETEAALKGFARKANFATGLYNQIASTFKLAKQIPSQFSEDQLSQLRTLFQEVQHTVYKVQKRRMNFDDLNKVNTFLPQNKMEQLQKRFDTITEKITSRQVPANLIYGLQDETTGYLKKPGAEFRNKLRTAIRDYIFDTYTDANLIKKDRAASDNRIETINFITDKIQSAYEGSITSTQLHNEVHFALFGRQGDKCFQTGFLGRSQLRSSLNSVLDERNELIRQARI